MGIYLTIVASSILWKQLEIRIDRVSSIFLTVIVRAMLFLALLALFARVDLVGFWVILLLFPSMAEAAAILVLAAV